MSGEAGIPVALPGCDMEIVAENRPGRSDLQLAYARARGPLISGARRQQTLEQELNAAAS